MPDDSRLSFEQFVDKACKQDGVSQARVNELREIRAAMSPPELANPALVDYAARARIAAAAGVEGMAVSQLIRSYHSYCRAMSLLRRADG